MESNGTMPRVDTATEDGTLVVKVAGPWRLNAPRPDWNRVVAEAGAAKVRVVAGEIPEWDSSLLLFLLKARAWSAEKGIPFETAALPAGLNRLLAQVPPAGFTPEKQATPARSPSVTAIASDWISGATGAISFVGESALSVFGLFTRRRSFRLKDLLVQMELSGARALPIIGIISFLVGVITAFQGAVQLRQFGADILIADLVALSTVREMGPVMAAIVQAGRTGAAFAAHIGNMEAGQEIDALRTFAISPIHFLVLPRILALTLMMPLLVLYADLLGILGGLTIAVTVLDIPVITFWNRVVGALDLFDVGLGLVKGLAFAILVALAGCYYGLRCERTAAGVGRATTSAVVVGIFLIIATDALFGKIVDVLGI